MTTLALLFVGWVLLAAFEWNRTLGDMDLIDKLANSWFLSVTPRTAGFNSVDYGSVGNDTVTLTILTKKDEPTKDVEVKLTERPKGSNVAARWYDEDLGFGVREMVFMDTYARKLPQETKGVVVSIVKPQSAVAAAKLGSNDLITELNGANVTDLEQFKKSFETIRKEKPKEAIVLVVLREGNTQTIRIEPPQ